MRGLALAALVVLGCGAVSAPAVDATSVEAAGGTGPAADGGEAVDAGGHDGPLAPSADAAEVADAPGPDGGHDGPLAPSTDAATMADAQAPDGGCAPPCGPSGLCVVAGGAPRCTTPAATIDHLRWEVPCGAVSDDKQLCDDLPRGATTCPPYPADNRPVDRTVTFGGDPGTIYQVTVRLRGVVEPHVYTGGSRTGGHFQVGGAPVPSGYDVFSLAISSPPATFYVNADDAEGRRLVQVDDQPTLAIEGGATVRIQVADADCKQVRNCVDVTAPTCQPVVIPGFPPSNGQFIQLDVVAVKGP